MRITTEHMLIAKSMGVDLLSMVYDRRQVYRVDIVDAAKAYCAITGDSLENVKSSVHDDLNEMLDEYCRAVEQVGDPKESYENDNPWALVWHNAGVLGIDPRPFTFGELSCMARGRLLSQWDQVCSIVVKIHNVQCKNKIRVNNIHPLRGGRGGGGIRITEDNLDTIMQGAFGNGSIPRQEE